MSNGYVYVMDNPAMPGLFKVGRSANPWRRVRQLSSATGIPHQFNLRTWQLTGMPRWAERATHAILAEFRVSRRREFFQCNITEVCDALAIVGKVEGATVIAPHLNEMGPAHRVYYTKEVLDLAADIAAGATSVSDAIRRSIKTHV